MDRYNRSREYNRRGRFSYSSGRRHFGRPYREGHTYEKTDDVHVDREQTTPILLRAFLDNGRFHSVEEYEGRYDEMKDYNDTRSDGDTENSTIIYVWKDTTLREIVDALEQKMEENKRLLRLKGKLEMALVFPDRKGKFMKRSLGAVYVGEEGQDDDKTLGSMKYQGGDFLSVAIFDTDNL